MNLLGRDSLLRGILSRIRTWLTEGLCQMLLLLHQNPTICFANTLAQN